MLKRKARSTAFEIFIHALKAHFVYLLLPLLIFSILSLVLTYRQQETQVSTTVLNTAQSLQDELHSLYVQSDSLYLSFYHNEVLKATQQLLEHEQIQYDDMRNYKMIMPWLRAVGNAGSPYDSVYVYTANTGGRFLSSGRQSLSTLSASADHAWYQELQEKQSSSDQTWIATRHYMPYGEDASLQEKHLLTIFRTIGNQCCIMLNMDADALISSIENSLLFENEAVIMLDREGNTLLTAGNISASERDRMDFSSLSSRNVIKNGGHLYTMVEDWNRQMRLVIMVPIRSAYHQARIQMYWMGGALLLSMMLCILLSYRRSRQEQSRLLAVYERLGNRDKPFVSSDDLYTRIEQNMLESYLKQETLTQALQQKQLDMQSMELLALQAQINPHFLVNTLTTIYWKSLETSEGKPNAASHMLENLNGFLGLLTGMPNETISWREEIEGLHCYLNIQKERYTGRFVYEEEIDDRIYAFSVTKLLIQPIMENCFVHALPEQGILHIQLQITLLPDHGIHICVKDDGNGMTEEQFALLQEHLQGGVAYRHIGLVNVSKRLTLLYGLKDPLKIMTLQGRGTCIELTLPMDAPDSMMKGQNL